MTTLAELIESVAGSDDVAYVLSRDLVILRTNAAWAQFALANEGADVASRWSRGARVMEAIPEPLRPFYAAAFQRALTTGKRWEHDYECSTPETFRMFRMTVYPMNEHFLVVVNALTVSSPHARVEHEAEMGVYAVDGVVTTCSHCRRVRNPLGAARWDWAPDFVRAPPSNLSHGLCPPCAVFYGLSVVGAVP